MHGKTSVVDTFFGSLRVRSPRALLLGESWPESTRGEGQVEQGLGQVSQVSGGDIGCVAKKSESEVLGE